MSVSLKKNKFKGFSRMILRLVSGPMLEKSNKIGLIADRQKILLTAKLNVTHFLGFSTTRDTENFQKSFSGASGNFRNLENLRDHRDSGNSRKFSRKNFSSLIILTFFLIFSFSDLIFSILSEVDKVVQKST